VDFESCGKSAGLTRLRYAWIGAAVVLFSVVTAAGLASAQQSAADASAATWKTGASFQKQLKQVVGLELSEAELRGSLRNLADNQRVAIFLDRRIDPNQQIEFSASGVTLEELLSQLAEKVHAGTARIGSVIYVGPPPTAGALSSVAAARRKELGKLPKESRRPPSHWSWDELAQPRQILEVLARENGLTVENADVLPHDLWAASDFPPMDLADKLTLLLAGFDLTFDVAADGRLRLGPLPLEEEYEQAYTPQGDAAQVAAALKREFPRIAVRREGNRLIIRGNVADHERIARRLTSPTRVKTSTGEQKVVYTMNPDKVPAGTIIGTVAKRLGRKFSFAPDLREKLSQPVSFQVKDASLDELMKMTLEPLGLTYRITDESIEVVEK